MTTHVVPSDHFELLARGYGDMLGVLRAGQRSKRLLLLRELRRTAILCTPHLAAAAGTTATFTVLADAQRRAPAEVDDLLLDPHVGAWIMRSLRKLLVDRDISPEDLGHLGAVAAVAATRARLPFEVTAAIRDSSLMLPSLGRVLLPAAWGWCRLRSDDGDVLELEVAGTTTAVSLSGAGEDQPAWVPLRHLASASAGVTIDMRVDDLDPFRGCGHLPISGQLDAEVVDTWQSHLDDAWSLLVRDDRPRAEAMATGLAVIVPLRATEERAELSATCHEAVGAMGMTPPANPVTMALALVHEFQHNKLSALLDLVKLLDPSPEKCIYSPWRPDPRRLRGLLQGAYAYLGLAEFWELRRRSSSSDRPHQALAHFEFALARDQVGRGLRDLRSSGRLTPPGVRFVNGMARRQAELDRLPVPLRPQDLARMASADHETSWRLRNVRFGPGTIDVWAATWLACEQPPRPLSAEATIDDGTGRIPSDARLALIRQRLAFGDTRAPEDPDASPADALVLDGKFALASETYLLQIADDPDDLSSWAGLALAQRETSERAVRSLIESPETVLTLHRAVRQRTGTAPKVKELARWIDHASADCREA